MTGSLSGNIRGCNKFDTAGEEKLQVKKRNIRTLAGFRFKNMYFMVHHTWKEVSLYRDIYRHIH